MSRWNEHGGSTGPNWLVDALGRVLGYRDKNNNDYQIASQTVGGGAESVAPGTQLPPGGGVTRKYWGAVANQAAMVALAAVVGDWCTRTDLSGQVFELTVLPASSAGNWIAYPASGGGATNITFTRDATTVTVLSDTGTDAILPAADGTNAGVMTSAMQVKLAGIATGATANSADATLLARANHTGTQLAATVSDFNTAADARIGAASVNALADVIVTTPSTGQVLKYDGTNWVNDVDAGGGSLTVQDEGSPLTTAATTINFTGAGVTATGAGATKTVNIPGAGTATITVKENDSVVSAVITALDFLGADFDVTESPSGEANIVIAAAIARAANVQPVDATLTALAALTIAANSLTIGTGADAFSQTTFAANTFPARASTGNLVAKTITDFGLSIVDDPDQATALATIGAQPLDGTLTAVAGLTITANSVMLGTGADAFSVIALAANKFLARSSAGNAAAKDISDFGLSLIDDADATAALLTLGAAADLLGFTLPSGTTAITHSTHANRIGIVNQAGGTTGTFAATATSGALAKDTFYLRNTGAGVFTASGAISAKTGYKLTADPNEVFTADYDSIDDAWWSTTPEVATSANSVSMLKAASFAAMKTLLAIVSTDLSDFAEAVDDRMGAAMVLPSGAYDDAGNSIRLPFIFPISVPGALTTGTNKFGFNMPFAMTLTGIFADVGTAPTGATLIVDVNEAGSTIMTTNKLVIDATETSTHTAATPPTLTDTALAKAARMTLDIDQVGSTVAGSDLNVFLVGFITGF